jgi:hypothetical protein
VGISERHAGASNSGATIITVIPHYDGTSCWTKASYLTSSCQGALDWCGNRVLWNRALARDVPCATSWLTPTGSPATDQRRWVYWLPGSFGRRQMDRFRIGPERSGPPCRVGHTGRGWLRCKAIDR